MFGKGNGDLIAIIKYAQPNKYSKDEISTLKKIYDKNKDNDQVKRYYDQAKKEIA